MATCPSILAWKIPCSRKWQPAPVFLSGKFYEQRNLAGSDTTEQLSTHSHKMFIIISTRFFLSIQLAAHYPKWCMTYNYYQPPCTFCPTDLHWINHHTLLADWLSFSSLFSMLLFPYLVWSMTHE